MKTYSPNLEERAFLFQEAQALAGLMKDMGSLSVMVEEVAAKPKADNAKSKQKKKTKTTSNFRVTFVVAPESFDMRVEATAKDIYQAAIAAREETERQLNAIVNEVPRSSQPTKIPFEFLH